MIRFFSFCDHNYAAQVSVMLESLLRYVSEPVECVLYQLDASQHWGKACRFPDAVRVDPISIVEAQQERLAIAEKNRSWKSYCWTLEPAIVHRQLLDSEDGKILCYCDADMFWFADPIPAIRSVMEHADVALSPHYFPLGQESRERTVGKYNFGCGVFRACDLTRRIVGEWLDQTLEKCDEFGAGDQKYLDAWPEKLGNRLAELPRGWNAGPWQLALIDGGKSGTTIYSGNERFLLQSFHFHEFRRGIGPNPVTIKGEQWNRCHYPLHPLTIESVYKPYEAELSKFL